MIKQGDITTMKWNASKEHPFTQQDKTIAVLVLERRPYPRTSWLVQELATCEKFVMFEKGE